MTPTAISTATPTVEPGDVDLFMPAHVFYPGDRCELVVSYRHPGTVENAPLYVLLDVWGSYFFAPGWTEEADHYTVDAVETVHSLTVIESFTWPDNAGELNDLAFVAALLHPSAPRLISDVASWPFAYGD